MIHIKPFKGLRPVPDKADVIASLPYDVLDSREARVKAEGNPFSFLHVVKPEIDLSEDLHLYDAAVYDKGLHNLTQMVDNGLMIQGEAPSFYVYKMIMGAHEQVGIVALTSVEDYLEGRIKKHEHTKPDKEKDRTQHILKLNAHTGPVIMMYRDHEELNKLLESSMENRPLYDIVGDYDVRHIIYKIKEPDITRQIQDVFQTMDTIYIGDGHHRSAAAAHVQAHYRARNPDHTGDESYNYFLSVLFPMTQMQILDYNRVVKDLNGFTPASFIQKISEKFEVVDCDFDQRCRAEAYRPIKPHEFGMYLNKKWYILEAKPDTFDADDPVESLDIAGIRGLQELERLVNANHYSVAFSMFPTRVDEILAVADAGEVMPPKSTWFEPKLRSGLIVHPMDDTQSLN